MMNIAAAVVVVAIAQDAMANVINSSAAEVDQGKKRINLK